MPALALQLGGLALSTLGCLGAVLSCALPMWKVTAFIGANLIVAQVFWEGLWMSCVHQSTGQTQCKAYDSLLDLPADLQAARALVLVSIAAVLALLAAIVGATCSRCVDEPGTKGRVSAGAGAGFLLAGLALLTPVSWSARTIISNFYNPLVPETLKRELGLSLYMGWVASALLALGGAMLRCLPPPKEGSKKGDHPVRYWAAGKRFSPRGHARKGHVAKDLLVSRSAANAGRPQRPRVARGPPRPSSQRVRSLWS